MRFSKWQGCGNDFVLVDCFKENVSDFAAFAKKVCDRHYGIGGDGVLYVLPSDKADFRMRIFNTDGSEAEMCGNGIRCFALSPRLRPDRERGVHGRDGRGHPRAAPAD